MCVAKIMAHSYKSAFTMHNPPLLVAWLTFEFTKQLDDAIIDQLKSVLANDTDFAPLTQHASPHVIWLSSPRRAEVVKSLGVFATPDKQRLVGASRRELLYITTNLESFGTTLDFVETLTAQLPKDTETAKLQLDYYNVFESGGLTTDLVINSVQGPKPEADHEHREFVLSREVNDCWYYSEVSYRHGNGFKPEIRGGVEQYLAFNPSFNTDRKTNCYAIALTGAIPTKTPILDSIPALINSKEMINQMFLSLVTEKAREVWQIKEP